MRQLGAEMQTNYRVEALVERFGHFVTPKNPQADAWGYNPVRQGGDSRFAKR